MLLDPQRQLLHHDDDRHEGGGDLVAPCMNGLALDHRIACLEMGLIPSVAEKIPRSPALGCMVVRLGEVF
jgi:hypothetical protein